MANTVTRKELFVRIKEAMAGDPEVIEMCDKYIAQLSKPRKATVKPEVVEARSAVATWLAEQTEPVTQTIAGEALDMSGQRAGAALRWLVSEGKANAIVGEKAKDPKTYIWVG